MLGVSDIGVTSRCYLGLTEGSHIDEGDAVFGHNKIGGILLNSENYYVFGITSLCLILKSKLLPGPCVSIIKETSSHVQRSF